MPRKFDGKRFNLTGGEHKKKDAKKKADRWREKGRLVRVVPAPKSMQRDPKKNNWRIYTRNKQSATVKLKWSKDRDYLRLTIHTEYGFLDLLLLVF